MIVLPINFMKQLLKATLLATVAITFGVASEIQAQDRETLSARANRGAKGVTFRSKAQSTRVDDRGRPLVLWRQQVVYRALNDTFIYRSQNKATTRHDEVSSYGILFHVKEGQVRKGHVYQKRDN